MKCECDDQPRYTKWLTVERPAGTADAGGHIDLTQNSNWSAAGRIKGRFISKGGREGRVFDQVQADVTHVIETPSTDLSRSIVPKWRLRMDGRTFNITAAYDVDEAHSTVRIEATEAK